MKERILSPWTKKRKLYTFIGLLIIGIGLISKEWIFGIAGAYYFAMGFFSFGCAAGNCADKTCSSSESVKKH